MGLTTALAATNRNKSPLDGELTDGLMRTRRSTATDSGVASAANAAIAWPEQPD